MTSSVEQIMRMLVYRQRQYGDDRCTTIRDLRWCNYDLTHDEIKFALREAKRRGWVEYVDPTGWRAVVIRPKGQRPDLPFCPGREAQFAWPGGRTCWP